MEKNKIDGPKISLEELVDQISTRSYRELETEYERRIAADKRFYGEKFVLIRDEWRERNIKLDADINSVLDFKGKLRSKIKLLSSLKKDNEANVNNNEQIVSVIDEIIELINQNKDLKMDDSKSWYTHIIPEYTLEEYLEKYGYTNYFQNLRNQYSAKTENKSMNEPEKQEVVHQSVENENKFQTTSNNDDEIEKLQAEKFRLLFIQQIKLNEEMQKIGLSKEEKQRIMSEIMGQTEEKVYLEEKNQAKSM